MIAGARPIIGFISIILFITLVTILSPGAFGQVEEEEGGVNIALDSERIEVVEGRQSHYWIIIENSGDKTVDVYISFDGEYQDHAWVNRTHVPLLAHTKRQIRMTIYAPVGEVDPGSYSLTILAQSDAYNNNGSLSVDVVVTSETSDVDYNWVYILVPLLLIPVIVGIVTYRVIRKLQKTFKVFEIFIVHNDGRLIKHFPESDEHMADVSISAMFTAIQEFMADSFEYGPLEDQGYLSEVVFGEIKVYVERNMEFYIALVTKGEPPKDLRKKLEDIKNGFEEHFGETLPEWDGNLEPFEDLEDITLDSQFIVLYKE